MKGLKVKLDSGATVAGCRLEDGNMLFEFHNGKRKRQIRLSVDAVFAMLQITGSADGTGVAMWTWNSSGPDVKQRMP